MQSYDAGDVVVVPFPFTDRSASKRRPALVCSRGAFNAQAGHLVLAMITTSAHAGWPDDVPILDLGVAGLPAPSVVRWKLFTLDASLVVRRSGKLAARDRATCAKAQPVRLGAGA
jgi:mRNA interferase MazF